MLVPVFTVAENVVLGHEPVRGGGLIDLPEARRRVKEISDRFGFHVDPDAYDRGPARRRPAARRDHQGAVPAGQGPHPRRAHRGAHAAGDRRADRDHAPAQGVRDVDRLHHAQAARGPRRRRPDHRHPARQGGRQRRADVDRDRARLAHGRSVRSTWASTRTAAVPGEATVQVRHLTVIDEAGVAAARRRLVRRAPAARSSSIAGVQGNGQTELTEVHARAADARRRVRPARRRRAGRASRSRTCSTPGVGFVPEDRSTDGVIADFSIAENLILDLHRHEPFATGRRAEARRRAGQRGAADRGVRRPHRLDRRAREHAVRRQPAEGRAGARDVAAAAAAHRVAADPWPRRRLDRVRAPADRRGARQRHPRDHRVDGARRGARARATASLVMYRGRIVGDRARRDRPRRARPDDGRRAAGGRRARRPPSTTRRSARPTSRPATTTQRQPSRHLERAHRRSCEQPDAGPAAGRRRPPPGQTGVAEPTQESDGGRRILHEMLSSSWLVSVLAVVLALILGGLLIAAADAEVQAAAGYFFSRPSDLISAAWTAVSEAYAALFAGCDLRPAGRDVRRARSGPLTETLTVATPLILAGLGLGIGFRAGLFNIGAQGQIILGGDLRRVHRVHVRPAVPALHLLLCVIGAALGGALWAGIAGVLKARTGAHEVIVTIMLNNIAIYLVAYLLSLDAFQRPGSNNPVSPPIPDSAAYPLLLGERVPAARRLPGRHRRRGVHVVADGALDASASGSAPSAPTRTPRAPPASRVERDLRVGHAHRPVRSPASPARRRCSARSGVLTAGVAASYGFDAITVALLGRSKPLGTVLAGILFGALRAGGVVMQARTGTPDRHRARRAVAHRPVHRGPAAGPVGVPAAVTGHATRPEAGRPRRREGGQRMSAPTIDATARPSARPASELVLPPIKWHAPIAYAACSRCSGSWSSGCSRRAASTSTFARLDAARLHPVHAVLGAVEADRDHPVPRGARARRACRSTRRAARGEGRCLAADHLRVPHGVRVPGVGRRRQGQRAAADRSAAGRRCSSRSRWCSARWRACSASGPASSTSRSRASCSAARSSPPSSPP